MPLHLGMVDYLTGRYNFRDQEGRIDFDMLIELLETHKLFNTADTRNRVRAFLDK